MQIKTAAPNKRRRTLPIFQIVSRPVPGRIRYYIDELYRSRSLGQKIETQLSLQVGVFTVSASPLTGHVLVIFDPSKTSLKKVTQTLFKISRKKKFGTNRSNGARKTEGLQLFHAYSIQKVAKIMGTSLDYGLSPQEAHRRLLIHGFNTLEPVNPRSNAQILSSQFQNLPTALLLGSAGLSILTGGVLDAVVIAAVTLINGGIGYKMESSAEKTIHSIERPEKFMKIQVKRAGKIDSIDPDELVPGDVFFLTRGQLVPADGRLVETDGLNIDESLLTGESLPENL